MITRYLTPKQRAAQAEMTLMLQEKEARQRWAQKKIEMADIAEANRTARYSDPDYIRAMTGASMEARTAYGVAKPIVLAGLLALFILGPGIGSVLKIFDSVPLWALIGSIVLILIIWRRR